MDNLCTLLISKGEIAEPEALLREYIPAVERLKGPTDGSTLSACHELAVLLYEQRRLDEAEDLFLRVTGGRRALLGSTHLDTLSALNNLGMNIIYKLDGAVL